MEKYNYVFEFLGPVGDDLRFMFEPNGEDSVVSWELLFNPTSQPETGCLRQEYYNGGFTKRFRYVIYGDKVELWHNNPKGRKDPYIGVFDGSEKALPIPKGVFKAIIDVRNDYKEAKEINESPRDPDMITQMAEMLGLVDSPPDERPLSDELKDTFKGLNVLILGAHRMRKTYQRWAKELGCCIDHPDEKEAKRASRLDSYFRKADVVIAVIPWLKHIGSDIARMKVETSRTVYVPIVNNSGAQNIFIEAAEQVKKWKAARHVFSR